MSRKYAIFCNSIGETQCGSDSVLRLDGRLNFLSHLYIAKQYRLSYLENFPHKADNWTHVMFTQDIKKISEPYSL